MAQQKIWTTQMVEEVKELLRFGQAADLSCFHERDIELKGEKILFKLSPTEYAEFQKCSEDINYFVGKYCRFMTDAGRKTVKLRKYQTEILETLAEEHYIEALDDMGPKTRNFVLMSSRQTGKCQLFSQLELQDNEGNPFNQLIDLFYYQNKQNLTMLDKIKFTLLRAYNKVDKW